MRVNPNQSTPASGDAELAGAAASPAVPMARPVRHRRAMPRSLVGGLLFVVGFAVFGPAIAPHDPNEVELGNLLAGPSSEHWLGVDGVGRDILSRLFAGAPVTLTGPFLIVVAASIAGAALGIVSAWKGGAFDAVTSRCLDVLFAFPTLLFAVLATALFGAGLSAAVIALAVAYAPYIARLVRSVALRERRLPYVEALVVQGQRPWRIVTRHVVPKLSPFILVQATLSFGYALLDLAALNFLGFGVQPPQADWGSMVSDGLPDLLAGQPAQALSASVMIVFTVWLVTEVGERLARRWVGDSA